MSILKSPIFIAISLFVIASTAITLLFIIFSDKDNIPEDIDPLEIYVNSVEIVGTSFVVVGANIPYLTIVLPDNATNIAITWSVFSRGGEATIDENGILSPTAAGGVTIRATAPSGLYIEKNVAILTTGIPVAEVSINGIDNFMHGDRETYSIVVTPSNATYSNVVWSIQSGAGKVDNAGRLAAKDSGTLTLQVSVDGVVATKTIDITPYIGSVSNVKVLLNRVDLRNTVLKDYKNEFEALYPMYKVTFETLLDYENNARLRLGGNDYGDVLLIPSSVRAENLDYYFAKIGSLESLESSWRYVNQKTYNGDVYGLPTYGNVNGILYNKKVFAEAGITELPSTPEEFLIAMATIKAHYADDSTFLAPFYTNKRDSWPLDQWQGNVSSVSGNPQYYYNILPSDRSAFIEGSPHYIVYSLLYNLVDQSLIEADPSTTNWERSKVEFVKGNIGAMVVGSWAVSQFIDVAIGVRDGTFKYDDGSLGEQSDLANPNDVGYMPFPYTHPDGSVYSVHAPDFFMGIARNSKNIPGATDFMMWFLRESGYYELTGGIPPRADMPFPPVIQAFQDLGVILFEEVAATGSMMGKLELVEMESDIVLWNPDWKNNMFEHAFHGTKSYAQIANELNTAWTDGIDQVFD